MTLQRRHFELIAEIINDMDSSGDNYAVKCDTARHFAINLRNTNPNFNRARFLKACGVEQ